MSKHLLHSFRPISSHPHYLCFTVGGMHWEWWFILVLFDQRMICLIFVLYRKVFVLIRKGFYSGFQTPPVEDNSSYRSYSSFQVFRSHRFTILSYKWQKKKEHNFTGSFHFYLVIIYDARLNIMLKDLSILTQYAQLC